MGNVNKGKRRITFRLNAPEAKEVSLGGDFNGWNTQKHPLKKKPGGIWEKTVMLAPGRYEYKFMVDGSWKVDSTNSLSCYNIFGSRNSVIEVNANLPGERG